MSSATIRIDIPSSPQAFAYKEQLLADGLVWEKDFTWRYHPNQSDYWETFEHQSAYVEFTFKDEQLATYYRMKWL